MKLFQVSSLIKTALTFFVSLQVLFSVDYTAACFAYLVCHSFHIIYLLRNSASTFPKSILRSALPEFLKAKYFKSLIALKIKFVLRVLFLSPYF